MARGKYSKDPVRRARAQDRRAAQRARQWSPDTHEQEEPPQLQMRPRPKKSESELRAAWDEMVANGARVSAVHGYFMNGLEGDAGELGKLRRIGITVDNNSFVVWAPAGAVGQLGSAPNNISGVPTRHDLVAKDTFEKGIPDEKTENAMVFTDIEPG